MKAWLNTSLVLRSTMLIRLCEGLIKHKQHSVQVQGKLYTFWQVLIWCKSVIIFYLIECNFCMILAYKDKTMLCNILLFNLASIEGRWLIPAFGVCKKTHLKTSSFFSLFFFMEVVRDFVGRYTSMSSALLYLFWWLLLILKA